jgi:hypothetical protein
LEISWLKQYKLLNGFCCAHSTKADMAASRKDDGLASTLLSR